MKSAHHLKAFTAALQTGENKWKSNGDHTAGCQKNPSKECEILLLFFKLFFSQESCEEALVWLFILEEQSLTWNVKCLIRSIYNCAVCWARQRITCKHLQIADNVIFGGGVMHFLKFDCVGFAVASGSWMLLIPSSLAVEIQNDLLLGLFWPVTESYNLVRQIEHFPNPLDSSHKPKYKSIWSP